MSAIPLRRIESADAEFDRRAAGDRLTRFLLAHLLALENRVRALESRPPITAAAFRAAARQAFGTF